jgi:uncharacterized protein
MTSSSQSNGNLESFSGIAPLFPLGNVVLFPHALLPLHIFEPRYRKMTADALVGDGYIAMALIQPALPPSGAGPAIHPMVGLGKIIAHEKLPDGRYYLVLKGVARAYIEEEIPSDEPYRVAKLRICPDEWHPVEGQSKEIAAGHVQQAQQLVDRFCEIFPKADLKQVLSDAVLRDDGLAVVCDILSATIPLASDVSQRLLNETSVEQRTAILKRILELAHSQLTSGASRPFPPKFSDN